MTTELASYRDSFSRAALHRDELGVLTVRLHTDGGPLVWGRPAHHEIADLLGTIGRDPENRVVVITGTGEWFTGPRASAPTPDVDLDTRGWEDLGSSGLQLTWNLLSIDVPVISCVQGPVWRHPEIPLMSDFVLATRDASFQDSGHFLNDVAPGDGIAIFMPLLLGLTRARRMLYLGEELSAAKAFELGLVSELVPAETLMERGQEIATFLAQRSTLVLRYTRRIFMAPVKDLALRHLQMGLALEGLGQVDKTLYRGRGPGATQHEDA